jgi:hypothetical protein
LLLATIKKAEQRADNESVALNYVEAYQHEQFGVHY